jgi:hypothetical protein
MASSIVSQHADHRAKAHQLTVRLTDISSWSNNSLQLGLMLIDCADSFSSSDAAALDFQSRVLATVEAIEHNINLIGKAATSGEGEARELAAALGEDPASIGGDPVNVTAAAPLRHEPANPATEEADSLLRALGDCDALSQCANDAICAMAKAARKLLALDAGALEQVSTLLREIENRAEMLSNDINVEAERHGVNYVDAARRAAREALWSQHHALHGTLLPRAS